MAKKFEWKKLIASVAPTIATALGGPFAGIATRALSKVVLGKETSTEQELEEVLGLASPELIVAIKKADQDFQRQMAELDVDLEKIAAEDRHSARRMNVANRSWAVPVLATLTVLGFFLTLGYILTGNVTLESTLLGVVIGQIGSKAEQVYNFFFGSSVGSKEKTDHLVKIEK
jgi:hypothetical protein